MSSLSDHDRLGPDNPEYYAPRALRERSGTRPQLSNEANSEPARAPIFPPASLDIQLENAVSSALWHPLDPEVIHEPPGLARELDRRKALVSVVGRFTAAVGISAVVALFFVIMIPASRQPDTGALAGMVQSVKAMLIRPDANNDGPKPATAEFQTILASPQNSPTVTREQSERLLQQFVQWRQKPAPSQAP
ncbi:hypothetical protein KMZ93_04055 [Bradyrhizobium sediminis]|uniref:Uncharacterized protein n=1 Tax=Bradyrhizobium sediminis TaxID=2840469 RepID=A0A975NZE3_9BRAD|nr:hypothetical protein [Bradyrhizobium sediminis]QWG24112.1 hypothetical protein KMZ93_04055 [Bradyrhizobium sediminis]